MSRLGSGQPGTPMGRRGRRMRMLGLRAVAEATEVEGRGWRRRHELGFQELGMSGHIFGNPGRVP
jgi:hypothetical protein